MSAESLSSACDVAVIGGSAGSIEALGDLVAQLPPRLPCAIFVVVHVLPSSQSRLPQILGRLCPLPVRHAADGELVLPGQVLVAPPDHHLLLHPDHVELNRGPRENSSRPAIDPLFRTAAAGFGPRVVGAVLSGHLDDGSGGLLEIVQAGGRALVQDPAEASHASMPLNALRAVPFAEVLPAARIGWRIADLSRVPKVPLPVAGNGEKVDTEPGPDELVGAGDAPGLPTGLTCPECHGVLWAEPNGSGVHCRIGHRFSLDVLQSQQRQSVEQAMWAAVRALHEDASLARHMAIRAQDRGQQRTAERFLSRHDVAARHARVLEELLLEPREAPVEVEEEL